MFDDLFWANRTSWQPPLVRIWCAEIIIVKLRYPIAQECLNFRMRVIKIDSECELPIHIIRRSVELGYIGYSVAIRGAPGSYGNTAGSRLYNRTSTYGVIEHTICRIPNIGS